MFPFSRLTAGSVVFSALVGFNMIYSLSRSSAAAREKFLCLFFFCRKKKGRHSRVSLADFNVLLPRFFLFSCLAGYLSFSSASILPAWLTPLHLWSIITTAEHCSSLMAAGNYLCVCSFFFFLYFSLTQYILRYISQLKVFPSGFSPEAVSTLLLAVVVFFFNCNLIAWMFVFRLTCMSFFRFTLCSRRKSGRTWLEKKKDAGVDAVSLQCPTYSLFKMSSEIMKAGEPAGTLCTAVKWGRPRSETFVKISLFFLSNRQSTRSL